MYNQKGFTLVELLIVIAIVAILVAVAIPNFTETMSRNRMVAHTNELLSAVQYARAEALRRGGRVILAPTEDTNDWADGIVVFFDRNGDGDLDIDSDPDVNEELRYWGALDDRSTLTAVAGSTAIAFDSSGFASANGTGTAPTGTEEALKLVDDRGEENGRCVNLLISGSSFTNDATNC